MLGNQCVPTIMHNHESDPVLPPGFGPFASFSPDATQDSGAHTGVTAVSSSTSESVSITRTENQRKSRRNRRSVDYSQFDNCAEDYSEVYSLKFSSIAQIYLYLLFISFASDCC